MKNREKFAKEILDIAWECGGMAVTKENKIVCCCMDAITRVIYR